MILWGVHVCSQKGKNILSFSPCFCTETLFQCFHVGSLKQWLHSLFLSYVGYMWKASQTQTYSWYDLVTFTALWRHLFLVYVHLKVRHMWWHIMVAPQGKFRQRWYPQIFLIFQKTRKSIFIFSYSYFISNISLRLRTAIVLIQTVFVQWISRAQRCFWFLLSQSDILTLDFPWSKPLHLKLACLKEAWVGADVERPKYESIPQTTLNVRMLLSFYDYWNW